MSEARYIGEIETRLRALVHRSARFEQMCLEMEGAYPVLLKDILTRWGVHVDPNGHSHLSWVASPSPNVRQALDLLKEAPEAHPLNFDWYFHESTLQELVPMLSKFRSVLCLGCPTVFAALQQHQNGGLSALVDINEPLLDFLRLRIRRPETLIMGDLRKPLPRELTGRFEAVVVDPPWYTPFYFSWLQRAAEAVRKGEVFLSLFPRLLRPTAAQERTRIVKATRKAGADVKVHRDVLLYDTPPFETAALGRSGISLHHPWKKADLLQIRIERPLMLPQCRVIQEPEIDYLTYQIDRRIVKLRKAALDDPSTAVCLQSPYEDGSTILKSVSRRDRERTSIHLWFSNGRVYRVKGGRILAEVLGQLQMGLGEEAIMNCPEIRSVVQRGQIKAILETIHFALEGDSDAYTGTEVR